MYFHHDDYIEYDNYGEPIYSGAYFRRTGQNKQIIKMDRNHLPQEIWEGKFVIHEDLPIRAEPTGPQKCLFINGKFVAEIEEG